ncbi:hypothetical protein TWF506_010770 [Arthrobotrys conoides]|uniref:BTB domain-containing protein n=1 Tax=Arthrobotrys conoides TaxID=74498 RepID=A0AAN8NL32_9PEZI
MANLSSSQYFSYSAPDIELVVGDGAEQTTVKVHESVIAPPSEFFRAALNAGLKETTEKKIYLPDITWVGMEEVLNWLYKKDILEPTIRESWSRGYREKLTAQSTEKFVAVLRVVDFLQISQLKDEYQKVLEGFLKKLHSGSPLLLEEERGGFIATILHEFYKIGGEIDDDVFYMFMKTIKMHCPKFPESPSMNGFRGFQEVVNDLEEPNAKFLHVLCKAYSFL